MAGFRLKVWRSRFPLYASFRCESACTLPTREKGGDESDPPPKAGGHVTPIAVLSGIPLSGPMGSLSSSFIPAGRLRIEAESRCLLVETPPPFPSRFIVSDRSSPSRVRFAASRPGRLRADPGDALFTREKGGSGRVVRRAGR